MSQCSSLSRTGFPLPSRVKWRRDHLGVGHHLMPQSEPLRLGRERQQTDAGGVAAGPVEPGEEAELNRVWRLYVAQRIRGGLSGSSSSAGSRPSLRRSLRGRTRSDPDTTVLIPPIAFEPFDRPRRLIIGNHPPAIEPERGW